MTHLRKKMPPVVEVADILRAQGDSFREQNCSWLGYQQLNVLRAITSCRTALLGGHVDACSRCDHQAISYNSFATDTVPNARRRHVTVGWQDANRTCSAYLTSMSSLPCPIR